MKNVKKLHSEKIADCFISGQLGCMIMHSLFNHLCLKKCGAKLKIKIVKIIGTVKLIVWKYLSKNKNYKK